MDWADWHKLYDAGLGLSERLRIVREQIRAALDEAKAGPIRIVSICSGDGRDVVEAASAHPRRGDVIASLLDNHAPSLERGRLAAGEAGLGDQLDFILADATQTESYEGIGPADLIIISGVLGHVSEDWVPRFLGSLPMLCKTGGSVIWNRHLVVNRGAEHVRLIQRSLEAAGFNEVDFEMTSPTGFAVARARFGGASLRLEPGLRLFEFAGLDRLLQQNETASPTAPRDARIKADGIAEDQSGASESGAGQGESLPTCLERRASLHPDRQALGSGAWQPSYAELNRVADGLGAALRQRGGSAGDRVAILMHHDGPLVAVVLAVFKAGRVVVVLNPTDPPARLRQVLADAEPVVLVTDAAHRDLADAIAGDRCDVQVFDQATLPKPAPLSEEPVSPDAPAVLIYTSGSTGPPKGVLQSQRNLVHKAMRVSRGLEFREGDRVILLGALSGGQGLNTTLCALLNGATLCPFPIMNIGVTGLADWLAEQRITIFVSAASVFRHFVRTLEQERRFPRIRLVWLASEPATSHDVNLCRMHFADECVLFHTLASSETGIITQWSVARSESVPEGQLPVGRAADGMEVLLLDESGAEVAPGLAGEIAVRSRHLSTGYWRNDALTARRFFEIPGSNGVRLFRSGDRGRRTADGLLMFLGREDTRVNVHGYRVELAEIEQALARLPAVEKGIVAMHRKASGDEQVAAYVMLRPGFDFSTEALREGLRATLPGHMIPTAIVFLESFPLTPHGKVDRDALRQISPPAHESSPQEAPATDTEKLLAEIWRATFACGTVGRRDHFFDLGGDSLTAAVMAAKIHAATQVQLDLRVFAEHPTLAELARIVEARRDSGAVDGARPLERAARDEPLPLSYHQERVWKYSQGDEAAAGYGSAGRQLIRGPLDVALLRESISHVANRHEILRTTFPTVEGRAVQLVHPPAPVDLPLIDLSAAADPEDDAARLFREETRQSIDLARRPLLRFLLIRLRESEHQLFRITHHIVCDAWSWDIFFDELRQVYEARLSGEAAPLAELAPLHYGDYAAWQRRVMAPGGTAYRNESSWWKARLSNPPPPLELPFRRPRPVENVDPGEGGIRLDLDCATTRRLRQIGRDGSATYYAVRLAAYVALLAGDSGKRDIVLGTYVTNRNRLETQKMFGFFANLVTLRFHCDPTLTFREWLAQVGAAAAEYHAHGEIPYEELREELLRQGAALPEIRAVFSSSNRPEAIAFGGLELTKLVSGRSRMAWGFDVHFYQGADHDKCRVVFHAGVYDPAGVRDFIRRLFRFLDEASLRPDSSLAELLTATGPPLTLPADDPAWDPRIACGNVEQSLPRCFETVAQNHGSKKAIGSGSWQPTYARLNGTANRLARRLAASGAPGDRVALLMGHDGPVIAALLAVLKAGRIVVALHANGPAARSRRICDDADPSIIITDALHREAAERMAGGSREVICFDESLVNEAEPDPAPGIAPDAAAFLIYTSGSSGQPKGVVQNHRNILHAVRSYTGALRLGSKDRICLLGSLGGGQGIMTTFSALLNGATLYPYAPGDRGVAALPDWLVARKISVFTSAASVFRQLTRLIPDGATFPHLRLVRLGAEPALRSDVEACWRIFPAKCEFAHVFSSTETCAVSIHLIKKECAPDDGVLPVGRPLAGKAILLLREDGTEAQPGEPGEIAVRSRYLSPGYWRDPALTSASFRVAPGGDERIFRTGDLGRWREDGTLQHLGRADGRQNELGNRFELGEIESALRDQPQVADVVVARTGDPGRVGALVAWVVARRNASFDEAELRRALRDSLPESMIPSRIILADSFPAAANGKPDRGLMLSQLDQREPAPVVHPRTGLEKTVAAVWSRVAGFPAVGVYDHFFESGGDSLRAVDLVLSLSLELRREIPTQALIRHPTIAQLAEAIESGRIHDRRQPWLRRWKASVLALREEGGGTPLLVIPGGYVSENELLVFTALVPHLDREHPVFGARLNLHATRVIPPLSVRAIARAIGKSYIAASGRRLPVVIGECQSCPLACEVAQWLARHLGAAPLLLLLDPWHPRTRPPRDASHPPGIRRLQRLLGGSEPGPYAGKSHVICAREAGRLALCRDWWRARLGPGCEAAEVPGGHHSYIRQHRKSLVEAINERLHPHGGKAAAATATTHV
jgi:amino acid adenylation domain-containing protein